MTGQTAARWWRPGRVFALAAVLAACCGVAAQPPFVDAPPDVASEFPVPQVTVRVKVPADAPPGKELTYRLTAENCSKASAHHVQVKVTLSPAGVRFVRATPQPQEAGPVFLWKLGTLAGCEKRDLVLVVEPTGADEVSCCARVQFEHGQCVKTRIRPTAKVGEPPPVVTPGPPADKTKAVLRLRKLGPADVIRYDIKDYRLEVQNVGGAAARNLVVRDRLPTGVSLSNSDPATKGDTSDLEWKLPDLAPGKSALVKYSLLFDARGSVTSRASAVAAEAAPAEANQVIRVRQPLLKVLRYGPAIRIVDRATKYEIVVSNPGDIALTNLQLTDQLIPEKVKAPQTPEKKLPPEGTIEFGSASDGGQFAGGKVRWNLGTLPPGASKRVQLIVRARNAGLYETACFATADRGLTEESLLDTLFVDPAAGVAVKVDLEPPALQVDQVAKVHVHLLNAGKARQANVATTVVVPPGLKVLDLPGVKEDPVAGTTVTLPAAELDVEGELTKFIRVKAEKAGTFKVRGEVVNPQQRPFKNEKTLVVWPATSSSKKPARR